MFMLATMSKHVDIIFPVIVLIIGLGLVGLSVWTGKIYFKLKKQWNAYQEAHGGK
jgi:hypothetical protein